MFLVGGPAYSGTTLLALLLNQNGLVCLDEPDFHDPKQSRRGIPVLQRMFPERRFPAVPVTPLSYREAVALIARCEAAIAPALLGIKTCNSMFLSYASVYRSLGHPVIAIFRDIRDATVRPLPPWVTLKGLNRYYRLTWYQRDQFDLWIRYEDLVRTPDAVFAALSETLGRELRVPTQWPASAVPDEMMKTPGHALLRSGSVSHERIGVWKTAKRPAWMTVQTAELMGYPVAQPRRRALAWWPRRRRD